VAWAQKRSKYAVSNVLPAFAAVVARPAVPAEYVESVTLATVELLTRSEIVDPDIRSLPVTQAEPLTLPEASVTYEWPRSTR
jgi:hypothetical protein